MQTTIEIDDELMKEALKARPFKARKEAVNGGLKLLVRRNWQCEIRNSHGKLKREA